MLRCQHPQKPPVSHQPIKFDHTTLLIARMLVALRLLAYYQPMMLGGMVSLVARMLAAPRPPVSQRPVRFAHITPLMASMLVALRLLVS